MRVTIKQTTAGVAIFTALFGAGVLIFELLARDCNIRQFRKLDFTLTCPDALPPLPPPKAARPAPGEFVWIFGRYVARCTIPIEMAPYDIKAFTPANPATHNMEGAAAITIMSFELALQNYGEVGKIHDCVVSDERGGSASQRVADVTVRGVATDRFEDQGRDCVQMWYQVENRGKITMRKSGRFCQQTDGHYAKIPSD